MKEWGVGIQNTIIRLADSFLTVVQPLILGIQHDAGAGAYTIALVSLCGTRQPLFLQFKTVRSIPPLPSGLFPLPDPKRPRPSRLAREEHIPSWRPETRLIMRRRHTFAVCEGVAPVLLLVRCAVALVSGVAAVPVALVPVDTQERA